jgi:hypothetical protein
VSHSALRERAAGAEAERRHSPAPRRQPSGSAPTVGRAPVLRLAVQRLPEVSEPHDPLEAEAAQAAQRIVAGQSAGPISSLAGGAQRVAVGEEEEVQRVAVGEEEVQLVAVGEDEVGEEPVQRLVRRLAQGRPAMTPGLASTLRFPSGGSPMPPSVRAAIEPGLGVDLGGVTVHDGAQAHDATARLQARAATFGSHLFLGRGESAHDLPLMAHEATHAVQQGAAGPAPGQGVGVAGDGQVQRLPAVIADQLADYARYVPGYTLLTVMVGVDPLTGETVERNAINLVGGLMGLSPLGTVVFDKLVELGLIDQAFAFVDRQLAAFNLSIGRLEQLISEAWDEMKLVRGFEYNLGVLVGKFSALVEDVASFAGSLLSALVDMVREAAIGLAEPLLDESPAWSLIKKVLNYDPLRGVPVKATTVEILDAFLRLIGRETEVEQMRAHGTLQETADWIDTQLEAFQSLVSELGALFAAAWDAIQPENLPNLEANLQTLALQAFALLQRAFDFATTVAAKVLELVKAALLGWLSEFALEVPGFHLLTVILGHNPFTGEEVPRSAENLIRGFITLLPGGNATYDQLAESGVIGQAAANIEGAMSELGISWEMVTGLFRGIWDGLSIDDLVDPIGAFVRIRDQFGEPILRLFAFIRVVLSEIFQLVLRLMNFPTEMIARIITNAMQAYEDISQDPVGFLLNMMAAVKEGFTRFFGGIWEHLLNGLMGWLFRGLRAAGIEPPTELTLQSALDLLMQILGITEERLWEKLAERITQDRVDQIRDAIAKLTGIWTFIRDVQEQGVSAIWKYIQGQLSNLWNTIIQFVASWLMERIITQGIVKLLSFLDPTFIMSVVNGFIAIFQAIQSTIEYLRDMLELVDKFVGTIASVARGDIDPGAAMLERGLIDAVPMAIGFLAAQVGLGNVSDKIAEILSGVREVVDNALDWLMDQAEAALQSILKTLGFGTGAEPAAAAPAEAAAEQVEAVAAGLPPEEIKAQVLDTVTARMAQGNFASVESVHGFLRAVMTANRERGLAGLDVRVVDPNSMEIEIEASASAPQLRRLSWDQIFSENTIKFDTELQEFKTELGRMGQATYAALAVDEARIGELSRSAGGVHAEEGLVTGDTWKKGLAAAEQAVSKNGSATVTLLINRTPCIACAQVLVEAIAEAEQRPGVAGNVAFHLAATGTYRRQARISEEALKVFHADWTAWATRFKRPLTDEAFKEQVGIWKEDLRSHSTEWVDPETGETTSSLLMLASAHWRISGLDMGGPVPLKGRRLEIAQIAAELAKEFKWSS